MRHIPLLAEEGAEREPDRAKPQKWLRHQENAAKPQKRRRRARSASAIARSRNWWSVRLVLRRRAELTTPSATNRNGSIAFDVADTPPLRGGECAPKTLSEKLKLTTLLHKEDTKGTKKNLLCLLWLIRT